MTAPAQIVLDALIEEHLAIQQLVQEAELGEPTNDAYERLGRAFAEAAIVLLIHTRVADGGEP